eukprot:g18039.t1
MSARDVGYSLRQAVQRNANGIAVRTLTADGERIATEMSWAELEREVGSLSRFLVHVLGLESGDRLGVLGRNSADYLKLMYACADAGLIFVPLNTRWAVNELRHAVIDSGIKVMATLDREFVGSVLELPAAVVSGGPGLSWLLVGPLAFDSPVNSATRPEASQWQELRMGGATRAKDVAEREGKGATDGVSDTGQNGRECQLIGGSVRHHLMLEDDTRDVFCIVHTSGSTGRSKGVALTHLGQIFQAIAKCAHVGYTSSTTYLNVLPFFHVGGISSAIAVTLAGGCHVFVPKFTPACGSAAVQTGRVDSIVVVPTMLHMLIKEASNTSSGSDDMTSPLDGVDTVVVGGQPMSRRLERLARKCMPGARLVQTYACTEAGSTITFASCSSSARGAPLEASPGSRHGSKQIGATHASAEDAQALWAIAGSPPEHVEIRIVDRPSDSNLFGCAAAAGVVGEVETRGPHVMKGYWKRPDLTTETLRPNGWLRTGDLGRLDAVTGRLVIIGRAKDIIKTGGEKVHSSEVESVLLRHIWVVEAAAYGVDDERLGEKVTP